MRTQINPYKKIDRNSSESSVFIKNAKVPKKITICMLTHIPNEVGYYNERLEILDITLSSLIKNTDTSLYDLLVLDNGSNTKTAKFLYDRKESGQIDYLLTSKKNLGVCNGLSILLGAAPGEYVCWIPDDVYLRKGWLEKSMEIITKFPNVGLVTPSPIRNTYNKSDNIAYKTTYKSYENINYLNPDWDEEWDKIWCYGTGVNLESFIESNNLDGLKLLEIDDVKAYPMGGHFVTLMTREALNQILPFPYTNRLMGGASDDETALINVFDNALSSKGLVKLTTNGCYAEHLGNKIDERILNLKSRIEHVEKEIVVSEDSVIYQLNSFQKLIVLFFKLPILRRLPKLLVDTFGKVIFLKTVHRVKS